MDDVVESQIELLAGLRHKTTQGSAEARTTTDNSEAQIALGDLAQGSGTNHPASPLTALLRVVIATFMPTIAAAGPGPACSPSGTALSIGAKDRRFDKGCLAAPADQSSTIEFDNQDSSVPHNVAIYDRTNGKKPLFKGEVIIGPKKIVYSVPARTSGTYEFQCEPHDFAMTGTFIVGNGKGTGRPSSIPHRRPRRPSAPSACLSLSEVKGPFEARWNQPWPPQPSSDAACSSARPNPGRFIVSAWATVVIGRRPAVRW